MKKTTKLTALVLALVLTLALALTGCGKKTTTIQIAVPNDTTNEAVPSFCWSSRVSSS